MHLTLLVAAAGLSRVELSRGSSLTTLIFQSGVLVGTETGKGDGRKASKSSHEELELLDSIDADEEGGRE